MIPLKANLLRYTAMSTRNDILNWKSSVDHQTQLFAAEARNVGPEVIKAQSLAADPLAPKGRETDSFSPPSTFRAPQSIDSEIKVGLRGPPKTHG